MNTSTIIIEEITVNIQVTEKEVAQQGVRNLTEDIGIAIRKSITEAIEDTGASKSQKNNKKKNKKIKRLKAELKKEKESLKQLLEIAENMDSEIHNNNNETDCYVDYFERVENAKLILNSNLRIDESEDLDLIRLKK